MKRTTRRQTIAATEAMLPAANENTDLRLAIKDLAPRVIDWMSSYQSAVDVETIEYLGRQLGALGRKALSREGDEYDFTLRLEAYDERGTPVYAVPDVIITASEAGRLVRASVRASGHGWRTPRILCVRNVYGQYVGYRVDL